MVELFDRWRRFCARHNLWAGHLRDLADAFDRSDFMVGFDEWGVPVYR